MLSVHIVYAKQPVQRKQQTLHFVLIVLQLTLRLQPRQSIKSHPSTRCSTRLPQLPAYMARLWVSCASGEHSRVSIGKVPQRAFDSSCCHKPLLISTCQRPQQPLTTRGCLLQCLSILPSAMTTIAEYAAGTHTNTPTHLHRLDTHTVQTCRKESKHGLSKQDSQ